MTWALLRLYFATYHRWTVEGLEHLPPTGGVVVMANHASHLDPPLIGAALPRPIRPMAKEELFRWAPWRWWISTLGAFPIRRGGADRDAIRRALEMVRRGEVLVVFPEGTRTRDGAFLPFQPGAGLIALKAEAPVLPLRIRGTFESWPKGGGLKIRPARIRIRLGPPIDLSGIGARGRAGVEEATARIRAAVEAL